MQKPWIYNAFFLGAFVASLLLVYADEDSEWMRLLGVTIVILIAGLGIKISK